ncbi:MAG: phenazine biosynthesis protein [Spirochaetes bacterium GWC1_27_15]|nr:MAG: phenazine biosynthesis protein [Spirochaetes bacterium GWC1_27_15]
MQEVHFYIVDVFAEKKFAGNQLAVIKDGRGLTDKQMQEIAKEINFSETTFIFGNTENKYDVRIFTPNEEVPFAGHPTLGTAFIIQKELLKQKVEKIILNLKVGKIPVTINYDGDNIENLWMKQIQPIFGETLQSDKIAKILGLQENDIDNNFPIQEVSTGLPFVIIPLKTLDAIKKINIDKTLYFNFVENITAKALFVFCPQTYSKENNINARVFVDYYGIPEDPATGSANGCFAAYLLKNNYYNKQEIDLRVEQGYEIKRPSLIYIKANQQDDKINIFVGGKAFKIAEGKIFI